MDRIVRRPTSFSRVCFALVLTVSTGGLLARADPAIVRRPTEQEATEQRREAVRLHDEELSQEARRVLQRRLPALTFHGVALHEAVRAVERASGVRILVDWRQYERALEGGREVPITLVLGKGMTLSEVMLLLCNTAATPVATPGYAVNADAVVLFGTRARGPSIGEAGCENYDLLVPPAAPHVQGRLRTIPIRRVKPATTKPGT